MFEKQKENWLQFNLGAVLFYAPKIQLCPPKKFQNVQKGGSGPKIKKSTIKKNGNFNPVFVLIFLLFSEEVLNGKTYVSGSAKKTYG